MAKGVGPRAYLSPAVISFIYHQGAEVVSAEGCAPFTASDIVQDADMVGDHPVTQNKVLLNFECEDSEFRRCDMISPADLLTW